MEPSRALLALVVVAALIGGSSAGRRWCANEDCTKPIATATVAAQYTIPGSNGVVVSPGTILNIFSKENGIWEIEVCLLS